MATTSAALHPNYITIATGLRKAVAQAYEKQYGALVVSDAAISRVSQYSEVVEKYLARGAAMSTPSTAFSDWIGAAQVHLDYLKELGAYSELGSLIVDAAVTARQSPTTTVAVVKKVGKEIESGTTAIGQGYTTVKENVGKIAFLGGLLIVAAIAFVLYRETR